MLIDCKWYPAISACCICSGPAYAARITAPRAKLLHLVAEYWTNAEIAIHLGITPATVKRRIEDLREITGCASKRELARWWIVHVPLWDELTVTVTNP